MTISAVTIVGAGYMGGGIAQTLAMAGFDVTITDVSVEKSTDALHRLRREAREFEQQGLFSAGSADLIEKHISAGAALQEAVASADFIEEAVFERSEERRVGKERG